MLAKLCSCTLRGLDGVMIEVEIDVASKGLPSLTIVGLPDKSVEEAKERVRSAIVHAGFEMPDSRITVNLAPAEIPKEGARFDMAIAVGILAASGIISQQSLEDALFLGELSLEGKTRSVSGCLAAALLTRKKKCRTLYVPISNAHEASLIHAIEVIGVYSLDELVLHLNGIKILETFPKTSTIQSLKQTESSCDFKHIAGQQQAKRALEIAAAGFHNLHLRGVPGAGKTLLSRALPTILPDPNPEEILEMSLVYSVSGLLHNNAYVTTRPFRAPHHTTSRIGLIGGGTNPLPGEISLAHLGVLFLDELPEFPRSVLESLRQPLEDGQVTVSRASGSVTFPCRFLLLAASNPCPCGYYGHPTKHCTCMPGSIARYRKRLSGPLIDRIDLHVDVPPVKNEALFEEVYAETSEKIRKRVASAQIAQKKRFVPLPTRANAHMTPAEIKKYCVLSPHARTLLESAVGRLSLSARSYFKMIKIAQTIADLENSQTIESTHIAEALQYRSPDG